MLDAWNKRDGAKFAAVFTEDGDFVDTRGARVHGRTEIGALVAKLNETADQLQQTAAGRAERPPDRHFPRSCR